jgi:hypothetical protein
MFHVLQLRVLKVTLISVKIWAKEKIQGLERINKMEVESLGNCGKRGNNRYVSGKVEPGT